VSKSENHVFPMRCRVTAEEASVTIAKTFHPRAGYPIATDQLRPPSRSQ
jgi:hypothetical protein